MNKAIHFYKEKSKWYADIPEWTGDKADLEMVCGADKLLDKLSKGTNKVLISINTEYVEDSLLLILEEIDESGGYYNVLIKGKVLSVWLCNVTLFVFNEFPEKLYFKTL